MSDSESPLNSPSEPPVKRHREGAEARRARDVYCTLGAARTPEKVADQIRRKRSQVVGWSHTYHWPDRAAAYDVEQAQIHLEQERQRQEAKDELWEQRERDQPEVMYSQAQKASDQGDLMMGFPLTEVRRTTKVDENGQAVAMQIIKAVRWSKKDAIRCYEFATAHREAAIERARAASVTKVIDIFDDLPLESLRVTPQ
jgi:hypothetical protein